MIEVCSVIDELKPILNYLEYEDPYKGAFANVDTVMLPKPKEILASMIGYRVQIAVQQSHSM